MIVFYYEDKILVVGNFKKILLFSDKEINFDYKRFVLVVSGDNLSMPYLEDKEVGIRGIINNISFKYKMVKDDAF